MKTSIIAAAVLAIGLAGCAGQKTCEPVYTPGIQYDINMLSAAEKAEYNTLIVKVVGKPGVAPTDPSAVNKARYKVLLNKQIVSRNPVLVPNACK